jgi:hypothetical protein
LGRSRGVVGRGLSKDVLFADAEMRFIRFAIFGLTLALTACDSPLLPWGGGDVEIRIQNNSSFPFERVEVGFPEGRVNYGSIRANSASEYRGVSKAYRYAYIEVEIAGEELVLQPIDYVGESLLGPGRYTYVLNTTVEGQLTLEFRED